MENVSDALKMAGSVLLFVLALSVAISSLTLTRQTVDTIIAFKDRETSYITGDENAYYYTYDSGGADSTRKVGTETIIPSIYRAFKDNVKVCFPDYVIFSKTEKGINVDYNYIDLKALGIGNDKNVIEFLDGVIYHQYTGGDQAAFENKYKISVYTGDSLYDRIKGKKFEESLGMYYTDEVGKTTIAEIDSVPNGDKVLKRVITYTEE